LSATKVGARDFIFSENLAVMRANIIAVLRTKRQNPPRKTVLGDHRSQSEQSRMGVGAVFQPWIVKGEQSGLLTHIAATESVLLCTRMKS
jgi:hypothetical protein